MNWEKRVKKINKQRKEMMQESDKKYAKKYKKFKKKYGFDFRDCWNLDISIAYYVLPRLIYLRAKGCGYPCEFDSVEPWNEILDKIIVAFTYMTKDDFFTVNSHSKEIDEGLDLFRKYFFDFWY